MRLFLFILLNAVLFIRPAEIVPALIGLPIYNVLMIACLASSFFPILALLSGRRLAEQPITVCVLGLLAMVMLSHLANFDFWSAKERGTEFGKVMLYYLLLVATLDTPARVKTFLSWLVLFTVILAGLALLQYHGKINIPSLEAVERREEDEETGEMIIIMQLCSTGIYNDPNDLCLILVTGVQLSLYRLIDRSAGALRLLWLAPIVVFVYAVILTSSRGGFLALLAGLLALFVARFGWKRSIPLTVVTMPVMFLLSGGRQTKISAGADTAQERMKLWSEGLHMLAESPKWALMGIGAGNYADEMGQVAHNSYVHAFVELGLLGGPLFLGAFYCAVRSLHRLGAHATEVITPEMQGLRPFLLSMLAGYAMGMFSLSRCYIVPTYMVLGLATAYFQVGVVAPTDAIPRVDGRLVRRLAVVSIAFLLFIQIFIRASVKYG